MPAVYGMLGQAAPAAASLTTAYTVPAAKHATIRVVVANRSAVASSFRVAISPNGAAIANSHYIAFDIACGANEAVASAAITLGSTDLVRVYSASGNVSFSVTGIEEDD